MARNQEVKKGFLSRLLRNEAGNTLVLTAAATLPLIGMIGGGVDISRMYLIKTRLQQACDAGALAGRKAQAGGTWTSTHQGRANDIFDTNFGTGDYGTSGLNRSFSENSGKVTGTASVVVPMMVMDMFRSDTETLSIICDAEMRLPHTDIMFVLDVTGSMGGSKISGLKTAVKCFYEILMKIDTPAVCGSTPSGGISDEVQVRFGFVPYNVNANVGKLLPNSYIADSWAYQTRVPNTTHQPAVEGVPAVTDTDYDSWGSWSEWEKFTVTNVTSESACDALATTVYEETGPEGAAYDYTETPGYFGATTNKQWKTDQPAKRTVTAKRGYSASKDKCRLKKKEKPAEITRTYEQVDQNETEIFNSWTYKKATHDVSGLKNSGSWNSSVALPVGAGGTDESIAWAGCIEERATVRTTNFAPIPSGAKDLDIDLVPDVTDPTTLWGPMLPGAVWGRTTTKWSGIKTTADVTSTEDFNHNIGTNYCPTVSRKLARYETAAKKDDFVTYINSLTADGYTYHDIGLIWGARLMSPTGIFASENAFTSGGGEIERHMIFMTDGDACTISTAYSAYGVPWWDRRRTSESSAPTPGSLSCSSYTTPGDITHQVEYRTDALCTAIKNKNITLWVINYGTGVSSDTGARLQACASPNRYYAATTVASLLTTFETIASQISQLRLTK